MGISFLCCLSAVATLRLLPVAQIARQEFGRDAAWYEANIPFFECADKRVQEIYYYRWQLYKAHIRDVGERGTVITEFLDDVPWQKWPFASLNDATPFHIQEGRWLRDPLPVNEYIDYLYVGGGNDRHFSEAIADATYQNYLARGDLAFAAKYLPAMRHIFNLWDDHYDFSKGLYWIEPLLDATEYTISSIDATGGRDGFTGGQSFRPTINAYQYGNARAIARFAALTGDARTSDEFNRRADELKSTVQRDLWSDKFGHFIDRFQVNNSYVHYWNPIRGRELAGYVPWAYHLPDDAPKYLSSWRHVLSKDELAGPYGLRTVEPSYEYYMRQYRYLDSHPECQWNGPSWPFQTTQVLTGLANVLNDYHQDEIHKTDYLHLLKQYAEEHYLNGKPDLQEDYDAETGKPIVGLDRSHHYNHSGYVDLIVTGLCGIRPQEGDALVVNPLVEAKEMPYFCLQDLPYHGHSVTVLWDFDGTHYHAGRGLQVFVDGRRRAGSERLQKLSLSVGKPIVPHSAKPADSALNVVKRGFPEPSASVNPASVWQAVDGRVWFFSEIPHGWSTLGSENSEDWFQVDFGTEKSVRRVRLQFFEGGEFLPPEKANVQAWQGEAWKEVASVRCVGNGPAEVSFPPVKTSKLRILIGHAKPARLVQLSAFSAP